MAWYAPLVEALDRQAKVGRNADGYFTDTYIETRLRELEEIVPLAEEQLQRTLAIIREEYPAWRELPEDHVNIQQDHRYRSAREERDYYLSNQHAMLAVKRGRAE